MLDGVFLRISIGDIVTLTLIALVVLILILFVVQQSIRRTLCRHDYRDMTSSPAWQMTNRADGYCKKCNKHMKRPSQETEE